jgi:hypothetical protein
LALLLFAFLFSIGFAELCLRVLLQLGSKSPLEHRIPHPVLGWVLEPDAEYVNEMPEGAVSVSYSSRGWHDIEHSQNQEEGTLRVLVLGDSFMEAYSVELEDAFHRQLGKIAANDGLELEVINFGVGGYGTLQQYLVFRELGLSVKPDLVLLGFYVGNDVRNNSLTLESKLATSSLKASSRPFLRSSNESKWEITQVDYEGAVSRFEAAQAERSTRIGKLKQRSYLLRVILSRLGRLGDASPSTESAEDRLADEQRRADAIDFAMYGVHYCDEPSEFTQAWSITEKILRRLKSDIANSGAELIVFSVPALYEVEAERIADVSNRSLICPDVAPGHERLRGVLDHLEIEYIELLPRFRERHSEKRSLFQYSDRHWNKNGHQLAASMVYQALKEKGHWGARSAPTTEVEP